MIAMVKNFGGWETQKKWELRAGDAELRLHLERKGVSRDLIRKMITVSSRRLSKKDYEGIAAVIKEIPLINFATPPEESRGSEARVNSPQVTAQAMPPQSSNHSRNTLEPPGHSSSHDRDHASRSRDERTSSRGRDSHDSTSREARRF